MGLFRRGSDPDEAEPSLGDAWRTLGERLGLAVEATDHSVRADGNVRGRPVLVEIESEQKGSEFLRMFVDTTRRNRVHRRWRTQLRVATLNSRGLVGAVTSAVDVHDPRWNPRVYDPAQCRVVAVEPPGLAGVVLTPSIHERLMAIVGDVRIEIHPREVRLVEERSADADAGFVAACFLHQYQGPILPWPERALAGPPWWIDLLWDVAAALEA